MSMSAIHTETDRRRFRRMTAEAIAMIRDNAPQRHEARRPGVAEQQEAVLAEARRRCGEARP